MNTSISKKARANIWPDAVAPQRLDYIRPMPFGGLSIDRVALIGILAISAWLPIIAIAAAAFRHG